MQISDNIFAVKMICVIRNCNERMPKRGGGHLSDSGGRESIIAGGRILVVYSSYVTGSVQSTVHNKGYDAQ